MTTFSDQTLDLGRIRAIPKALTLPEPVEPASAPVAPVESSAADTLDTYIRQNRAVTPRSVTEMRKVPRASIEEINDTDFEELRSRMLALGDRDTRSPAMKFLDLIDAPRNVIMSVLNSDLRKKAEAEGNTGTFGLGRVQFSDLLRSAGVNNRVAAGVLGFVGDVAFDPLTYIGPAGWGAKIGTTTKAGRAVSVGLRRTGKTALDRQIARLAAGGAEVVDEAAHGYLTAKAAQKGFTSPQEWISTLAGQGKDAKGIRNEIARTVYGDPSKSALERVFRPLGGERTMERAAPAADDVGNFAYDFFRSDSATDAAGMAARKFVEKYGEGTGKALRFGKAKGGVGSQILHVPFLDQYTVQVSPFTAGAVRALDNARLAMRAGDAVSSAPGEVGRPFLSLADELVNDEQELVTISEAKVQAAADHAAARMSYPDDLPEMPPDPDLPPSTDPVPPPGPTPIVPGGLEISPNAPERTSNYIVGDFVQPQPVKPVQGRIDFDVEGRAQELLDAGDATEMDEALDMARMEQAAMERQAAESAGAGVPPSTIGTTQEAGNAIEEGRQEGREGLLSPGSATTTPSAVDEAAGGVDYFDGDAIQYTGNTKDGLREFVWTEGHRKGQIGHRLTTAERSAIIEKNRAAAAEFQEGMSRMRRNASAPTSHRARVIQEARAAFSNVPPEQHDAWAALMDARAQTWAREGKGRTPDQFWEQLRAEKGKAGDGQLYQNATDIDTDAFRRFFKNSAVVDSDGKPLKVFHYTRFGPKKAPFEVFTPTRQHTVYRVDGQQIQTAWRAEDLAANPDAYMSMAVVDAQTMGLEKAIEFRSKELAPYLATSESARRHLRDLERLRGKQLTATEEMLPVEAGSYFTAQLEYFGYMGDMPEGSAIYPVYLSIQNPKWVSAQEIESAGMWPEKVREYKKMGHDGVIFGKRGDLGRHPGWDGASQIVVFDSSQVKSAIGNTGKYDPTNPNILLQRKGQSPLASLSFEQDGKAVMRALKSPNITSLMHESSHLFLPGLADQDLNVVASVYGVTPELLRVRSEQLPVADRTRWVRAHEHFARDFEKYAATGRAPTKELESVFAKLKDWFVAIYKKIIGTPLEREIDPRIRGVFDRMLGGENVGPEITDVGITSKGWVAKQLDDMLAPYRDMNAQMHDLQVMRGVDEQLGEDINGMMVTSDSAADLANAVYHHPDAPPGGTNLQAWMKSHKSEKAMRSLRRFVPGEIMAAIDGRPDLAKYIKLVPEAGGKRGGEFANLDTDVIVENLERLAGGEARERRRAIELAGNNDPRLRFYADIYETWPTDQVERQVIRRRVYRDPKTGKTVLNERGNKVMESHRGTVIEQVAREQPTEMVDAGTIPPGSVFTINGRQHVVIESEDGGGMIRYEGPDGSQRHIPGNIGEIPVDRGSIRAATEDELDSLIPDDAEFDPASELYQRDVSGQGGLFGSRVGRISSGEQQGGLFGSAPEVPAPKTEIPTGDPERMLGESDAAYRERVALHRKWAESAKNTSTLFQDDLDGGQPNLIPTKTPRQIFDEQHAAAMEAMDKQYKETLGRIAEKRDRIVKELEAFDPKTAAPTVATLNDLLKLGEMRDNADSLLQLEMRRARTAKMAQAIDAADDPVFRSQEVGERLYNLVRNDPKAASDYADAITARMEALNAYRETIKATLSDIADADELEVASLAKSLLGTDDASIALSVFAAPARFLRDKFGENSAAFQYAEAMDRFWRRTFGVRRGTTTQLLTDISADMTARPISERMHAMSRMIDRVDAMKLPLERDDAMNLLHAYVYKHLGDTVLNGGAFAWKIGPDGQNLGDSEMVQLLKRAQDAGALTPANIQMLKQAAAEHVDEMKRLGFSEQDYGVLGLLRPDYVYSPATKDAQQAMRLHAEAGSANPNVARAGPAFARARTLDQVRFPMQNPDDLLAPAESETRWHRFFVGDMALADVPDSKLRPEQLSAKAAVVEYLKRLEEDPEFASKFPPRPSDPMEINELAAQGRFQHSTGGAPIDKMKETDLSVVYGLRMGQHQHAMGMARLGEFLQRESFQIDPALFDQWERAPGQVLRLRGGTSARVVTDLKSNLGKAVSGVRIGDTVYRRLDSSLWSTGNNVLGNLFARMASSTGSKTPISLEHMLVHHAVADKIEDMLRLGEPKRFEELLHTADTLTGMWKQLTLMHPAWVVFNVIGDTANALAGGADPRTLVDAQRGRALMDVYRYRHNPEKLADIVVGLRDGREMTGTEFWNAVTNSRVVDNTLSSEAMLKIVEDNPGLLDAADRTMRKYTAPWFRANQSLQDWMRMMVFSSFLDQGVDTPIAAKRVLESIGDYSDFTKVEERFFRRVFPFYSWMRNNLGYQIMQLGQRPGYVALMPKLHTALEEATAGEAAVPENMRPGWMRDQLATQIGADPKSRISLMLGSALPSGDIASVAQGMFGREGAMKFLHYFTSNINPVITVPLQLGTGTEFFSGRSIGPDAYSGDTSVTDFAISQASGPLSEFGSKLPAAFSRSTEEGVARLAMRGRVQAFDDQRLSSGVRREFREQEQRIRSAVYRAQRDGDAELSAEARARLMQLYADALRRGMEDVVPDWAERQLAELTSRAG